MSSLDWNKLNAQKQKIESKSANRGGGTRAKFWRPRDGANHIRIMTAWTDEGPFKGQFWREVYQHWNVSEDQKGPVLCPKETPHLNGACPICDFVDALKSRTSDPDAQVMAKDLRAKVAYLLNIVDTKDAKYTVKDVADYKQVRPDSDVPFEVGDIKVQVYACPSTVFAQILSTIQTNQTDVTDPEHGHDVVIKKSGKGLTTRYETTIVLKPSQAPSVEELPDLSSVGFQMDENELLDLLSSGAGGQFTNLLPKETLVGAPQDEASEAGGVDDLTARMKAALA